MDIDIFKEELAEKGMTMVKLSDFLCSNSDTCFAVKVETSDQENFLSTLIGNTHYLASTTVSLMNEVVILNHWGGSDKLWFVGTANQNIAMLQSLTDNFDKVVGAINGLGNAIRERDKLTAKLQKAYADMETLKQEITRLEHEEDNAKSHVEVLRESVSSI